MNNKTKIALVTGGSRGLGKEMALRLAEKGIDVIVTYHTREQDALNVIAQVEQKGQRAAALQLDTTGIRTNKRVGTIVPQDASDRISSLFIELLERQFPIESTHQRLSLRSAKDYADRLEHL